MSIEENQKIIGEIISSRRTVRRFQRRRIERSIIEDIIAQAVKAPSASNRQPWRFFIAESRSTIEGLARDVEEVVQETADFIRPEERDSFLKYAEFFVQFRDAPVLIAVCFITSPFISHLMERKPSERLQKNINAVESRSPLIGVSLAIQNLLLYTHAGGLGGYCLTGPLLASDSIKNALHIPESWEPAALVAIGYPDETPPSTMRRAVRNVIRYIDDEK